MSQTRLTLCIMSIVLAGVWQPVGAQDRAAQLAEIARLDSRVIELHTAGRYAEATPLAERALKISEKVLGPEHPDLASAFNTLAEMYRIQGDNVRAVPLFRRALAIREKVLPEQAVVAATLVSLALLYRDQGDYRRAALLLTRALAIDEKVYGPVHLEVASDLEHLGTVYFTIHDYNQAALLFQRALTIREKHLKPDDPAIAASLNNLAMLLIRAQGDLARAALLFQRALEIFEKAYGPKHPEVAKVLNNLAMIAQMRGDFARATSSFQRSLEIFEKTFGPDNDEVATKLNNLAGMFATQGDYEKAISFKQRADEVREKNIIAVLNGGSQQQKQLYLYTVFRETDGTIAMHTLNAPRNAAAARLALTVILQRKGRALDAMSDQIASLRRRSNPDDKRLLGRLAESRSRLATLKLSGTASLTPDARAEILRLEAEDERLEDDIGRRSAEFRAIAQPITLDAVRRAVPPDAALVELFIYHPFNTKTVERPYGVPHYVAYTLHPKDTVPQWVELGDAASIDYLAKQWHSALLNPKGEDFKQLARRLDERVMRPIRKMLGKTRRVFLAPDGVLNLIPFAALVDENGQYLIENYTINYLTSGRDLLRLQVSGESHEKPKVFADPLYDLTVARLQPTPGTRVNSPAMPVANKQHSKDFTALTYKPLPGTTEEAIALSRIFPDTMLLTHEQATEAALKKVNRPRWLHIATHGFFLPDQPQYSAALGNDPLRGTLDSVSPSPLPTRWENPLLRSGLILAGVKQQTSGPGEDGVLTALEVAGLDLWRTKLVVLSACETGLGDVKNGEGVYGLRRALVLAGSETQMISLWKVSDTGTRDLMIAYYTRLQQGEGRTEALREVQLSMLRRQVLSSSTSGGKRQTSDTDENPAAQDYRHPYYWAAFIQSGDWRSLNGK